MLINKFSNTKCSYIVFFISVLFLNIFINTKLCANSLKITNLKVSEPFNLNFNKNKVFDIAFKKAFLELGTMITTSDNEKIIKNISLDEIKRLIDSFEITNEKFIKNEYTANFNVNFDKKKTYNFLEKKNILPSIPKKIDVLLIPIIVENNTNQLILFNENLVYKKWNQDLNKNNLLNYVLPTEELDDIKILTLHSYMVEDYDFKEILMKYDLPNYIILIIYQDKNKLKILSKVFMNNGLKIINNEFKNINLENEILLKKFINQLKTVYEDSWKDINKINTLIKLPITISLKSKDYKKIKLFEKIIKQLDLVSTFKVDYFDNENIFYKIIYNGTPKSFLNDTKSKGLNIVKNFQYWEVK